MSPLYRQPWGIRKWKLGETKGEIFYHSVGIMQRIAEARKASGRHKGSGYLQEWLCCLLDGEMVSTVRGGERLV